MKLSKKDFLLYAVTDSHALQGRPLYQLVEQAIRGGATMIQLREKQIERELLKKEALEIKGICQKYQIPFIINDDVELCQELDLDGVHIGQDDLSIQKAREILGEDKIIGVSAHNVKEAKEAFENGASYLGVGAMFTTHTKTDVLQTSFQTLKDICESVKIPVVAIGGIQQNNIHQLAGTKIAGVAVVSAIFGSLQIQEDTQLLKEKITRIVHQKLPACLSIAGSDCSGGAGIQADLKTMLANRVYGMSAITALTAQNTMGVSGIMDVTPDFLKLQLDSIFLDIYPEAVKIGMVSNRQLIIAIAEKLKEYQARNIVVDPVMVATSGAKLISDEAMSTLKEYLLPLATVLTPNIPEAEVLSEMTICHEEDMIKAATIIGQNYHCAVLVKGGHSINDANDLLYQDGKIQWFQGKRIANSNTHGTGCTLSSAIASYLARGYCLQDAVAKAKDYISGSLSAMLDLGNGSGPMDHGYILDKSVGK